ncbi:J domain-containing protein [Tropicibacter sp. S64]|uniref:J domain-containing protein n=1 Tax=Tropicibacter sp. S64 TaxID=3415122 RepID=UPI003C797A66
MPRTAQTDNPYDLLGVSPTDDFGAIRDAWKRLVKTYHPDVWYGSAEEATRRLMAVNDAYDRISVLHKRVKAEAEKARTEQRRKPQATRKPRAEARLAEPQQTAPSRPQRPSPYAGHFDSARAVFTRQPEGKVQAFA